MMLFKGTLRIWPSQGRFEKVSYGWCQWWFWKRAWAFANSGAVLVFFWGAKRVCWVYTPLKTNMTTEDHHFLIGYISSNGCLSVVMLVFRVVNEQ